MTDNTIIEIYTDAKYILQFEGDSSRLRVGFPCFEMDDVLDKHKTNTAYFITPENPFSQTLSDVENECRHQRFVAELQETNLSYIEGYGTNEDETWPREHSYLIFCDDATAMHTLAAHFGQKGMLKLSKHKSVSLLILDEMRYQEVL